MGDKYTVIFSADKTWYAVKELAKPIWLGVEKVPPPIPDNVKRPGISGAAIMPGRSYWRRFTAVPLTPGPSETRIADDEMVADYRDASWWTPGISEPVEEPAPAPAAKSKKAVK